MNNAPDASPLTPGQRRHMEQEYRELQGKYDSLTKAIAALDLDISRTQEEHRKRPLEEMRAEKAAERDQIVQRMRQIEAQLGPDRNPQGQQAPAPIPPKPSPEAPAPPDARSRTRKVPIWVWYFVVVLLGFVLGVVTDLAALFKLPSCTALWLAAALALISGVAILGFSWLPEHRSLHLRRDRIILAGLTLIVTLGLAVFASASCRSDSRIVIALRTHHDKYVTAWNDEGDRDWRLWGWTDHPDIGDWEWFTLECFTDGKAAFRTYHQKYVTAMGADREWVLRAATDKIQAWELFTLLDARTGEPLRCQDAIERIRQAEEQQIEFSLAILTDHFNRYVTAKDGKEDRDWQIWSDQAETLRDEQKFTVIMQ